MLRRLPSRQDREADERWACPVCPHPKDVYDVTYVLRSAKNRIEIAARTASNPELAKLIGALPGDVVVSRDFRAVYLIAADGSRRRADGEAARKAIEFVKSELAKEKDKC